MDGWMKNMWINLSSSWLCLCCCLSLRICSAVEKTEGKVETDLLLGGNKPTLNNEDCPAKLVSVVLCYLALMLTFCQSVFNQRRASSPKPTHC